MPLSSLVERVVSRINGQCDCACPDGSIPTELAAGPAIVHVELTSECNNHCLGCPNPATLLQKHGQGILEPDEWRVIFEKLRKNLVQVKLTGGEPTLYPHFSQLLRILDDLELPFDVFSNGRWQNPPQIIHILQHSRQFGGCLISLHGPSTESHEALCRYTGAFQETIQNIQLAVTAGIPVVLSTIITQKNYNRVDEMIDLAQRLGAARVVFNRQVGEMDLNISANATELMQAAQQITKKANEGYPVKFGVCIPQCFVSSTSQGCVAGKSSCTIDPWGNVRPCNHATILAGNLLHQPLEGIWFSEALQRWRESPASCQGCGFLETCGGGCQAQALLFNSCQDILMPAIPTRMVLNQENSID